MQVSRRITAQGAGSRLLASGSLSSRIVFGKVPFIRHGRAQARCVRVRQAQCAPPSRDPLDHRENNQCSAHQQDDVPPAEPRDGSGQLPRPSAAMASSRPQLDMCTFLRCRLGIPI